MVGDSERMVNGNIAVLLLLLIIVIKDIQIMPLMVQLELEQALYLRMVQKEKMVAFI